MNQVILVHVSLNDACFLKVVAEKNKQEIGSAVVSKYPDRWISSKIRVEDFKKNTKLTFKLWPFGKQQNYRRKGIGTEMMNTLISEALKENVRLISGEIGGENPELLKKWYSRFGFIIDDNNKIELHIENKT